MTIPEAARALGWISVGFMCASIGCAAIEVRVSLAGMQKDVHEVAQKADNAIQTLNAGSDAVAWQAVKTMEVASGTLTQARSTIAKVNPSLDQLHADLAEGYSVAHDARLSLDNVNKAAIDERLYFERDLPPLMASVKKDVDGVGETLAAGKELLADQNLKRILANSGDMTDSGRSIMKDGAEEVHSFTHPTKKRGFVYVFDATGDAIKHWLPPLF